MLETILQLLSPCLFQGVFVASKKALMNRPGVLESAHELLERFEAHLRARGQFSVSCNRKLHLFSVRFSVQLFCVLVA